MPRTTHKYRLHKASGRAFIHIDGKRRYLGTYGSESSLKEYRRLLEQVERGQESKVDVVETAKGRDDLTISELLERYWKFADQHYRKNDRPSSEVSCLEQALRFLRLGAGATMAREFGPLALKQVRQQMIEAKRCRSLINRDVGRIRRFFRWAAGEELVLESLKALQGLQRGRCEAKDHEPIAPAPTADVEAVLPYLAPQLAAMVRLQLLTGCRPGEICQIRPCDVTRGTDGAWIYRPASHKTEHRGRERRIFLGPQAQEVLRPWLERDDVESYCFSPAEVRAAFDQAKRSTRRSPRTPSQNARQRKKFPQRRPKDRYSKDAYARAIARACRRRVVEDLKLQGITEKEEIEKWIKKNGLPGRWHPHQLRHTAATSIRERYGLEAASTVLGHSDARVTQIYAERDFAKASAVMREIG